MKLFGLGASRELGERIAAHAGGVLASHEERDFEDGEFKIRPLEDVDGQTVAVIHSLHGDREQSVNDKLCRVLFFVGAIKDAGAERVLAVVPYLAFARKDRRTKPRDPVTTRYLAAVLEAVGVDGVATLDVHNLAAFDNAFRCRRWHLTAAPLFVEHFLGKLDERQRVVVLSPDAGGVKRANTFRDLLEAAAHRPVSLGFVEKQRSEGRVTGEAFAGDVEGAVVIVLDDLISGGTTMARSARACVTRGAREVHAVATHAVFGEGAESALQIAEIRSVVVTDTIGDAAARCPALSRKLRILDSSALFRDLLWPVRA